MRVIVIGCGRVGALLSNILSAEGHQVAIIDRNPDAFRRLSPAFRGKVLQGVAFDEAVLKKAGIEAADALATVTNGDNTNYVLAAMARNRFHVPRVVARIYDPMRADIYRRLGIPTISSTTWGANRIRELLLYSELTSVLTVGNGEVEVMEAEISPLLVGHTVNDLMVPGEIQVVSVVRQGRAFIPTSITPFEKGDRVQVAVLASSTTKLEKLLGM